MLVVTLGVGPPPEPAAGAVHHQRRRADRQRPVWPQLDPGVQAVAVGAHREPHDIRVDRQRDPGERLRAAPGLADLQHPVGGEAEPADLAEARLEVGVEAQPATGHAERPEPLVREHEPDAVGSHHQLDARLAFGPQRQPGTEVAHDQLGVVGWSDHDVGSLDTVDVDLALVDGDHGGAGRRSDRGSMVAFQVPVSPSWPNPTRTPGSSAAMKPAATSSSRRSTSLLGVHPHLEVGDGASPDRSAPGPQREGDRLLGLEAARQLGDRCPLQPLVDRDHGVGDGDPVAGARPQVGPVRRRAGRCRRGGEAGDVQVAAAERGDRVGRHEEQGQQHGGRSAGDVVERRARQ